MTVNDFLLLGMQRTAQWSGCSSRIMSSLSDLPAAIDCLAVNFDQTGRIMKTGPHYRTDNPVPISKDRT